MRVLLVGRLVVGDELANQHSSHFKVIGAIISANLSHHLAAQPTTSLWLIRVLLLAEWSGLLSALVVWIAVRGDDFLLPVGVGGLVFPKLKAMDGKR